jgi:anti-sigma regulatory factor (Ser/Thr protein kinase)
MILQKNKFALTESYPSDQNKRKDIVRALSQKIIESGVRIAIEQEELILLLDEAITNAMEHGNGWNPDKKVIVTVNANPDNMHISIADEGKGFDTSEFESSLNRRDLFSNRGRGIYLINQFCTISWNKKGNQINLQIRRKE